MLRSPYDSSKEEFTIFCCINLVSSCSLNQEGYTFLLFQRLIGQFYVTFPKQELPCCALSPCGNPVDAHPHVCLCPWSPLMIPSSLCTCTLVPKHLSCYFPGRTSTAQFVTSLYCPRLYCRCSGKYRRKDQPAPTELVLHCRKEDLLPKGSNMKCSVQQHHFLRGKLVWNLSRVDEQG